MFKFLKLRNSDFGDARRHVPFASIIHKPLFLIFALLFSFVCIVPVKVSAAAPNLTPEFEPIYDTDITNFQDSYLNLDPAAQAAASILFGAYLFEYAGLADFGTVFESAPTDGDVWDRLEFAGQQFIDLFFLPVNAADQLVLTPLINLGQGILQKVKNVSDVEDFKNDILDVSSYGLTYTYDIGFSLNQALALQGGLYNWQFDRSPFKSSVSYRYMTLDGLILSQYNVGYTSITPPVVRYNNNNNLNIYNSNVGTSAFNTYHNLFIDSTNNKFGIVNDSGSIMPNMYSDVKYVSYNNSGGYVVSGDSFLELSSWKYFNPSNFSNVNTLVQYIYNNFTYNNILYFIEDFVDHVYYGPSWDNKVEVFNDTDLGFTQTDSLQLLNPIKDAVFDLKALINQIVQAQPDPNYELPLQPIIYNITQVDGSPLTAEDLQGISFNVTPPESGIDVPLNVFIPFFDDGKGFISYMWYMTKPLVAYTRSFLDAITFDPVDGFNASGPGYFILGVAGLGLIGGVIVKFLL